MKIWLCADNIERSKKDSKSTCNAYKNARFPAANSKHLEQKYLKSKKIWIKSAVTGTSVSLSMYALNYMDDFLFGQGITCNNQFNTDNTVF